MAIGFANLGVSANPDINSSTDASSYVNTSWTPPTAGLIICFVVSRTGACGNVPTVSGNSLTWVQIATICVGATAARRITLFGADAAGATTGATTIDFAAETQQSCTASFFQATAIDLSGGVAAAFVQTATNSGTATSGSVTLAAAGHADNRPIAMFTHRANQATVPDAAWTEVDDLAGSAPIRGSETQWDADGFQNASASWVTSSDWVGMAAELKATVAATDPALLHYNLSNQFGQRQVVPVPM